MDQAAPPFLMPPFSKSRAVWQAFAKVVRELMRADPNDRRADESIERTRRTALQKDLPDRHFSTFRVAVSVLCDLRLQGWDFACDGKKVELHRPQAELAPDLERERVRRMHAVNKNVQLMRQSVRSFVRDIETKRMGPSGWVSVFSLIRDGRDLAAKLRAALSRRTEEARLIALKDCIDPYIQIAQPGEVCGFTGIPLGDIWRYFRHTWASEYQTVPGRNVMVLIRDAAAEHHPVIGIAALASPVVHLTVRDEWIGWAPQQFIEELRKNPSASWARWVQSKLRELLSALYIKDLVRDGVLSRADITAPTEDTIAALEEEGDRTRKLHHLHPEKAVHKNPKKLLSKREWIVRSETSLFRSKRCRTLASLLRARLRLQQAGFQRATKQCLSKALSTSEGRQAVETIRKNIKGIHIGNDVLDISVCGAVAPYSEVLGGKLVAMLLASPEIVRSYSERYGRFGSIIASSMAARCVGRKPRLTTLTTTSLYSSDLNQYTRIRIPAGQVGGTEGKRVAFEKLGPTRGQGSYHFSAVTVDMIEVLLSQLADGRSVNSIFGEGVSPRLRKIRNGLDICGFPTNSVLTHGAPRIVYGVTLVSNQRDYLLERAKRPHYVLPQKQEAEVTQAIAEYWRTRWLLNRIQRPDILERVQRHTMILPIQHGARVQLPRVLDDEPLFSTVDSQ